MGKVRISGGSNRIYTYGLRGVKEDIRDGKMRFGREVFSKEEERWGRERVKQGIILEGHIKKFL